MSEIEMSVYIYSRNQKIGNINVAEINGKGKFGWEVSPDNRSKCKHCGSKITKESKRLISFRTYSNNRECYFCEECGYKEVVGELLKPLIILFQNNNEDLHKFIEEHKVDMVLDELRVKN